MRVYIGYDRREKEAFSVAAKTAKSFGLDVQPLYEERLRASGLLMRPTDRRGQTWDLNSSAPQSTDFAIARFFVPILAHAGLAMFVDCDVVFLHNPLSLLPNLEPGKAVYCVKHREFTTIEQVGSDTKMDGQAQTVYKRKLWSSVMIFDCDHPANARLNLISLNAWPGRDLHAFGWLNDNEIGELPPEANWLVGLQPKPETPIIAHFTLGTPNMQGHEKDEYAELWFEHAENI